MVFEIDRDVHSRAGEGAGGGVDDAPDWHGARQWAEDNRSIGEAARGEEARADGGVASPGDLCAIFDVDVQRNDGCAREALLVAIVVYLLRSQNLTCTIRTFLLGVHEYGL